MSLRERLHNSYRKLATYSEKYLLPQEFYAILIFIGIGVAALLYRSGSSLWRAFVDTDDRAKYEALSRETDSTFAVLARNPQALHFWEPESSASVVATKRSPEKPVAIDLASIALNKASPSELERLPGVGEVMSKRIISYRMSRGKFASLEELMNISGIGPKKFEKMKPYLRLD